MLFANVATFRSPVLGDIVPGVEDVSALAAALNALPPLTYNSAQQLVAVGQDMINRAISGGGDKNWILPGLPGKSNREAVYWKLNWHATMAGTPGGSLDDPYPFTDDLKRWVTAAAVELNAVAEGGGNVDPASFANAWNALRQLPQDVSSTLNNLQTQVDQTAAAGRQALDTAQSDVGQAVQSIDQIKTQFKPTTTLVPIAVAGVVIILGLGAVTTYYAVKRRRASAGR